jgi:ribulose 1,5-bisphosphate synthetase/thiazole synthase
MAPTAYIVEPERKVPVFREVDVCVVGGSPSGVAAAVCAARGGARVLLVEREPHLGGQSVGTMVVQWEKRAFINNYGAVCTRGIAKEFLDAILAKGGSDQSFFDPPGCEEMRDGEEWLDVEAIKLTLLEFCEEAGVELLLSTWVVDTLVDRSEARPRVTGVIIENKSGRQAVLARVVIDASADLDVVYRAVGEEGVFMRPVEQRIAPGWYTYFGGVDNERFIEYVIANEAMGDGPTWPGGKFEVHTDPQTGQQTWRQKVVRYSGDRSYPSRKNPDKIRHHLRTGRMILFYNFSDILARAREMGLPYPSVKAMAQDEGPGRFMVKWVGHDMWAVPMGCPPFDATDGEQVSRHECFRVKADHAMLQIVRLIPGWEKATIARSSHRMGLRETRVLRAVTMLTADDIFTPDHDRPDVVGRSGAHDPGKNVLRKAYPIPYGCLVPEALDGCLCAARPVGTADRIALDAHRGITPTIVVGQAAGTAAALAVRSAPESGVEIRDVDVRRLQEMLREADVVLDVETVGEWRMASGE